MAPPALSPAERWICSRLTSRPQPLLSGLAAEDVVTAARANRVDALLAEICETDCDADREIRARLVRDRRRAVLEAIVLKTECRRIVEAFTEHRLTPLMFKGAALAHSVYPAPWTRPFSDVDLLVPEADVPAARRVLALAGYEPAVQVDGTLITHQAAFVRSGPAGYQHQIDVHWRLFTPEPLRDVLTYDELIARAEGLPRLSPAARAPGAVDALVIALVHRAAHHRDARDLIWVWDIDRLAGRLSHADWELLVAIASRHGVRALCMAGLARAATCFSTPVPESVVRALSAGEHERSSVFLDGQLGELDIQLLNFTHLRWRDRAAFVAQHLFPSPAYMRGMYGATSTWRLARSYVTRLAAGIPRWLAESRAVRHH